MFDLDNIIIVNAFNIIYVVCIEYRGLTGRHVAQAQLMQSCLAVIKASMLVVQRSQDAISAAILQKPTPRNLQQAFSGLLQYYTHILTNGRSRPVLL